jgi:hypothetical protein
VSLEKARVAKEPIVVTITSEQLEALAQSADRCLRVLDPSTNKTYVIVEETPQSAASPQAPGKAGDSFLDDLVTFDGETPADLSARHDDYLYGDRS